MDHFTAAATDAILAAVIFACAILLTRRPGIRRAWRLTLWFAGALAGTAHHGLFRSDLSWTFVGIFIVSTLALLPVRFRD